MKKYKLKKWYPSLLKDVRVGDIITENGQHYKGVTYKGISYRVEIWQLHPDFWELVKEPLFVTEDGVAVYEKDVKLFAVHDMLGRASANSFDFELCEKEGWKLFFYKKSAEEYIILNKPFFSIKDISVLIDIDSDMFDKLKQLAKERAKE